MRKWCPEPFVTDRAVGNAYQSMAPVPNEDVEPIVAGFRPEAGFADRAGLLRQLSRTERIQVMDLLELDLRSEYEERTEREEAERKARETERRETEAAALQVWQSNVAAQLEREYSAALADLAGRTAEVAVILAEKLVRREVEADPEVLVRALETVLYKADAGADLSITVHPDDAAWLAASTDIRERLRITEVKEDRRLDRGGCLVKANDVEWDATVKRQLAVLGETLEEALAVPAGDTAQPEVDDA